MIAELLEALRRSRHECAGLRHDLSQLIRRLYGTKSERFNPNQPWLIADMAPSGDDNQADTSASAAADQDASSSSPKRKGHGRKRPPNELPRQRLEHQLTEAERLCPCCGEVCQKFGEDVSEQLDYKPASLFVWQHVRFKYACRKCHDYVKVAPAPVAVIAKGLPGPGLLAQLTACKYADHLPLHRLERILARHGVNIARSTMCNWMAQVAKLFRPVVDLMAVLVRQSKAVHTDATKMPFLDPDVPGKTLSGQMWVYFGDRDHAFNVFDFCRDHSATGIDAFLKSHDYRGYLNADAQNVYDHLFLSGTMIELGCWAHCRRKFYEAKDSDVPRAHLVLARIRQLYEVESKAKKLSAERKLSFVEADELRRQQRQEHSLPVVTALRQWLLDEEAKVLPKSPMGLAIAYALRHWQALVRYLDDGFLDIDNNAAELTLRHIAIGRKNWLFAGSQAGARTAAILFSVTSTCHRHGIDAFAYVRDLLERLAHDPEPAPELLRAWLPDRWQPPPAASSDSS
ncbi:MAG TPA: IS66 family transposase [Gemmataceae bacterium]|jgi:transposase|nr:IS66 family transposase [Gemmataceae bacterium]